jgi:RNA polymerase sigma-70 factor (ECF subfamily)
MDVTDFDAERPRLTAIAIRILGSEADADDGLQEAWLRLARTDDVDDLPAWLTTVVTRLCLDHLRKRRTRSEAEVVAPDHVAPTGPEDDALLAESMGGAMQVVLDALAPAERAAFVLHDVFGYPFDEISAAMGRSGTAVRQLASRARRKVRGEAEPVAAQVARTESRRVVDAFLAPSRGGDLASLLLLLAPDAVMRADLIGQQMGTDPVYDGAAAVAARFNGAKGALPVTIDGDLGGAWMMAGKVKVCLRVPCRGRPGARDRADRRSRRAGDLGFGLERSPKILISRWAARATFDSLGPGAGYLPGRDVEPVEDIGRGD